MEPFCRAVVVKFGVAGLLFLRILAAAGAEDESSETRTQLRRLHEQNDRLQQQLEKQQQLIEELNRKVSKLQDASPHQEPSHDTTTTSVKDDNASITKSLAGLAGFSPGKVRLSGEGAIGLFHSQPDGHFPNAEFRIDEAKLFAEAPVWDDVYFFAEINVFSREESNSNLRPGELYLDVENVSRLWGKDRQLNLRVGRIDIPFGEEYLTRDAIDNPLISHSLMDLWGVDEGVELYGSLGNCSYVLAVQNGGHDALRDYNADKAVAGRVGVDPARWLHLSVSAMRTGALDVKNDKLSELWLGPAFVRPLGGAGATTFGADLVEGDVHLKFPRTTIKAAGGLLRYRDNDPAANNRREVYYYSIEAQQQLCRGLYSAARWSQVFARKGFPIVGNGNVADYGFGPALTRDLWQLSLGLGYR